MTASTSSRWNGSSSAGADADQITESRHESLRQPGRPVRSLAQHMAIFEAIEAGLPRQAAAAMRRHVRTVAKVRLLDWDPEEDGSQPG